MVCFKCCILGVMFLIEAITPYTDEDRLVDPASKTLHTFKNIHRKSIGCLTTSSGRPVDTRDTNTSTNAELLTNPYYFDALQHLVNEKIPERALNPKGIGAHGYFKVTNNVTQYTKALFLERIGKITPLFARLASGQIDKGGSDAALLGLRGFLVKLYTEEGNLDFLGIQTPVFNIRSPALFSVIVHAVNRKNPKTNLLDRTSFFDYVIHHPESLHWLFWAASEFGLPRGFKHMRGFPIHTYELYNKHGEKYYVRFKFQPESGYEGLSIQESNLISATDPDLFIRDFYNSIENQNFPSWRMEMDVLTEEQIHEANFNPFDVISLWPDHTYQTVPLGRIVLNKNVENHFKETEQSIFNPANLVPGINSPPDSLFKSRAMAYFEAHVHRLGINHNKIKVNCPINANTYLRDGLLPLNHNMNDAPTYYPNSFHGPFPYIDESRPTHKIIPLEDDIINFQQPRYFYNNFLRMDGQKQRLIDALVDQIIRVVYSVQEKFIHLLNRVDTGLAARFNKSLIFAKKSQKIPAMINDIIRD